MELSGLVAILTASVAILGLLVAYARHQDTTDAQKVNLNIQCRKHRRYEANIEELSKVYKNDIYNEHSDPLPVYEVVVKNMGNVTAYIEEVYIMTSEKEKRTAAKARDNNNMKINPKASETFVFKMDRGPVLFEAKTAYVVDQTGKKWSTGCSEH